MKELAGTGPQVAALRGIEFHDARLALHTDPIYAPASPIFRSFLNCDIQDGFCEASMWLGNILADAPPAIAGKLWKSWVTHRVQPAEILHEARFTHMLPTPATISAQTQLSAYQGRDGIWFAGGYLSPYDSQETALGSALRVAAGLQVTSLHSQSLLALPTEIGPEHVDP
jgi:predicted NAD/FAD-binding protein